MKSMPTARIVLDTRRKKNNGLYPVKLRVTFQRKHRYYPTGKDLSEPDFNRTYGAKPREEFKDLRLYFRGFEERAQKAVDETLPFFSFDKFEDAFLENADSNVRIGLAAIYEDTIRRLIDEGRIGNADAFRSSKESLFKFAPDLDFEGITPDFLRAYERWMLEQNRTLTTVGIYLRSLRALFNDAIHAGIVSKESYPFGAKKPKYKIPGGKNIKKALNRAELQKIFEYEPATPAEAKARDFWIFSYLCNGMNMKDIAELKNKNLDKQVQKITFRRAKTRRTSRDAKPAEVFLLPEAIEILDRYATQAEDPEAYIFPILTVGDTLQKQDADIKQFVKSINTQMRAIGDKLGIDKPVTTYVARHSFATMLKRSGAPMEFISESLRHQDLRTTEKYLDSFEDTTKRKYAKALLDFSDRDNE